MSTTLKDIAIELGVSVNTVSRALRDMPDIGSQTTQLIKETATRMGYRKNLAASYLKTTKSMMLGIVVPDICNPIFSSMYKGIENICSQTGYTLILGNSNSNPEEEMMLLKNMLDHGVDGVFLVPDMKDARAYNLLKERNIPYILLQRKYDTFRSNYIQSDDYEGGYLAAQHLFHLGHRKFLYISAPMYISSAKDRYQGFFQFLQSHEMETSMEVIECDGTKTGGYTATMKWLEQQKNPKTLDATAIFCFSDYVAYGVYAALSKQRIRIPDDISVIGYDNNEYSDLISPALTTIDVLPYLIGQKAAYSMAKLVQHTGSNSIEEIISPKLIQRASTGPVSQTNI